MILLMMIRTIISRGLPVLAGAGGHGGLVARELLVEGQDRVAADGEHEQVARGTPCRREKKCFVLIMRVGRAHGGGVSG
jgi:hypothetical protein